MVTVKKGVRIGIVIAILLLLALLLTDRFERGSTGAIGQVSPVVRIDGTRIMNLETGDIWSSLPGSELVELVPIKDHHFVFTTDTVYFVDADGEITAATDADELGLDEITDVEVTPGDDEIDVVIVGDPIAPPADPDVPFVEIDGTIDPDTGEVTPEDITPVEEPTIPTDPVPTTPADTTAPVITILGLNPVSIVAGTIYLDAGATAVDAVDGDVTSAIIVSSTVDATTPGTYVVIYTVSDAAGNTAVEIRNVEVTPAPSVPEPTPTPDTTAPVITILGANPISITEDTTYTDAGATAFDEIDGDLTSAIIPTSTVDATSPGAYTVTYAVSDAAGNTAVAVRNVDVIAVTPTPTPEPVPCPVVTTGSDGMVYAVSPTETTVIDPSLLAFHYVATDAELATYLAATRPFLTLDEGTLTLIAYRLPSDLSTFEAAIESTCDSDLTFTTLTTTDALTRDEFLTRIADTTAPDVTIRSLHLSTGTTFVAGDAPITDYVYMKADAGPCTTETPEPFLPDCPETPGTPTPEPIPTSTTSTPICPAPTPKLIAHTCTIDTTTAPGAPLCYFYPAGVGTTGHICDIPGTVTYGCYPSTGGIEGPGCGASSPCSAPGFFELRAVGCSGTCAEDDGGLNPGLKGKIELTLPATTPPTVLTESTSGTTYATPVAPSAAVTTVASGSSTKTTLNDHCINPDGSVAEFSYMLREYVCSGAGGEYVDIACPCKDPPGGPDQCFQLGPGGYPPWFGQNPPPPNPQWPPIPQGQPQQQQPPQQNQYPQTQ